MSVEATPTVLPARPDEGFGRTIRPGASSRRAIIILVPVLLIGLTTVLSFLIHLKINVTVLPLYVVAVMVTAWRWGLAGGIWGMILAWFSYLFFFINPILTFYILDLDSVARYAELILTTLITLVLTASLGRSRERFRAEHLHLREVLRQLPSGVLIADARSGQIVLANDQVEKIWGRPVRCPMTVEDYVGWTGYHPGRRPYDPSERPLMRSLTRGESVLGEELGILRGDGGLATIQVNSAPLRNARGEVVEGVVTFQDMTARRRAEEGVRLLAQASGLLSSSLDYQTTLSNIAKAAVPTLATWCAVYAAASEGRPSRKLRRVALAASNPADLVLLEELEDRYPLDLKAPHVAAKVLRTGEPETCPDVSDDMLCAVSQSPEHLELLRRLGVTSWIGVPLAARGKVEAVILLASSESGRRYESADLDVARALAERAALALENARLYRSAQDALQKEEREVERHKALAATFLGVTAKLSIEGSLSDLIEQITVRVREILGAHQSVTGVTHDGDWSRFLQSVSLSEKYAAWRGYGEKPDGSGIYSLVMSSSKPLRLTQAELEAHPGYRHFGKAKGNHPPLRGLLVAPLIGRAGKNLGVLMLSDKLEGEFSESDEAVAVQLAQMASVAIENFRLYAAAEHEIQERKRAETEVRELNSRLEVRVRERTSDLEETVKQLDSFSYSVAHDFRAPLRAMSGFSDILLEEYAGKALDAEAQDYLRRMTDCAQRMDTLIMDLLSYSRMTRRQVRIEPLDTDALVVGVVEQFRDLLRERKATVHVQAGLAPVMGHYEMLSHALSNLLTNATKFVAPGVRPEVRIWTEARDTRVRLWVEDNGIGIAPEYHDRVFGIFERLNHPDAYPGMGIGLCIARAAVERMGGKLGVESAVAKGSRFWLELPRAQQVETAAGTNQ